MTIKGCIHDAIPLHGKPLASHVDYCFLFESKYYSINYATNTSKLVDDCIVINKNLLAIVFKLLVTFF